MHHSTVLPVSQFSQQHKRAGCKKRILKLAAKVRDVDRQYEKNNNCEVDNGIYNKFAYDDDTSQLNPLGTSEENALVENIPCIINTERKNKDRNNQAAHFSLNCILNQQKLVISMKYMFLIKMDKDIVNQMCKMGYKLIIL